MSFVNRTGKKYRHEIPQSEIDALLMKEIQDKTIHVVGFGILIKIWEDPSYTQDGLEIPQTIKDDIESVRRVGRILDMGYDCFYNTDRYPNGPWCEVGDYVLFRGYEFYKQPLLQNQETGEKYRIGFIYDDKIMAWDENPSKFELLKTVGL